MKAHPDCLVCISRQALNTLRVIFPEDTERQSDELKKVYKYLSGVSKDDTTPRIATSVQMLISEETGIDNPYNRIKKNNYKLTLGFEKYLSTYVSAADDKLKESVRTAIFGNIIDLAANPDVEIEKEINRMSANNTSLIDYPKFKEDVNKAEEILYIADNIEEVVFDKILIDQLGKERVTVAVRDSAFMNDVTFSDAQEIELDKYCKVIPIGSGIAGVDINNAAPEFLEIFNRAPVVIAKGQGNFETLYPSQRPIYFLFRVKCDYVANVINLPLGHGALLYSNNNGE